MIERKEDLHAGTVFTDESGVVWRVLCVDEDAKTVCAEQLSVSKQTFKISDVQKKCTLE